MNHGPLLFLGTFVSLVASWFGLVLMPHLQFGRQENVLIEETGQYYPGSLPGRAAQGAEVYRANGCVYCHTLQVRGVGGDVPKWGIRRTVAQDYLNEEVVQLGSQRLGSDLSNVGFRRPDTNWVYLHLFAPRSVIKDSTMPRYEYLFAQRKLKGAPTPDALTLPDEYKSEVPAGYELVPTEAARQLIAYLASRRVDQRLFEAPLPLPPKTNAPTAGTNVIAGAATNLPAVK